jgi:hypothetical protein
MYEDVNRNNGSGLCQWLAIAKNNEFSGLIYAGNFLN